MKAIVPMMAAALALAGAAAAAAHEADPQYHHGEILVPAFFSDEPKRAEVSPELAEDYLRKGALAWKRGQNCVACHTTGAYLALRPRLTPQLGRPLDEIRELFVSEMRRIERTEHAVVMRGRLPAASVYIASGLAEWDRSVAGRLSPETKEAFGTMLALQLDNGSWSNGAAWPPYESDEYHLAAQAILALSAQPEWLARWADADQRARVEKLKGYLRQTVPPHDYARTDLLWAGSVMPELLKPGEKERLIAMIGSRQRPDGGWSIRSFAKPEEWGRGNRAKRLRAEPDFGNPASDGHQTGLVIVVLRSAGVPASDPRIQKGLQWIKTNQRISGRWWTRSLNTDNYQFISYSGTALPLAALAACDELTSLRSGKLARN